MITTGTFLNGLIHIGREQRPSGRADEPPSKELAESIKSLGFRWGRLKTGTPPRFARRTIDFRMASTGVCSTWNTATPSRCRSPSWLPNRRVNSAATSCIRTTACHDLVRSHIDQSPLFNGQIAGIGPRYCPSLEDKVMRFPDRERHQLFLEPEGLDVEEIYVNGFSMSLPAETQRELIHVAAGLGIR